MELIKIILFFIYLNALVGFENSKKTLHMKPLPVELSAYDGEQSILLSWSKPKIELEIVNLFFKKFGQKEFVLLAKVKPENTKYLDSHCDPGERYFYKLEFIDTKGEKYIANNIMPPFANCLEAKTDLSHLRNFNTLEDIVFSHISKKLSGRLSNEQLSLFIDLLARVDYDTPNNWIEAFPLKYLETMRPSISIIDDIISDPSFAIEISSYENKYRNRLYLDPKSWNSVAEDVISKIRFDWNILYGQYSKAFEILKTIAPLRIISTQLDSNQNQLMQIQSFHPRTMENKDVYILSNGEYIDITERKKNDVDHFFITVPSHWNHVELRIEDKLIQRVPILKNKSIIYTLESDVIPNSGNTFDYQGSPNIRVQADKSSLWINEIIWSPNDYGVEIEISGAPKSGYRYIVSNEKKIIWTINDIPILDQDIIIDTSFFFQEDVTIPILISLNEVEDSFSKVLEYVLLDTVAFSIARLPDGGKWVQSDNYTIGSKNHVTESYYKDDILPELFVIYQNYPNPFNSQTKISFDLLEDAILNLYITDAKGRVHDKLIDNESFRKGTYNYIWDGKDRATGIYFATLHATVNEAPPVIVSRKMIYLK